MSHWCWWAQGHGGLEVLGADLECTMIVAVALGAAEWELEPEAVGLALEHVVDDLWMLRWCQWALGHRGWTCWL